MPLSWLWVICMAIIRSGWVLRPRTVMVLQPLTSHMCPGCTPLVVGPTHARGGTLDLLMTDVPDLVRAAVVAPIGNSDHSSLPAVISMAQAVPNFCVGRKGFVNIKSIGIQSAVQYKICPGATFGLLTILLWFCANICPCWLDVMY